MLSDVARNADKLLPLMRVSELRELLQRPHSSLSGHHRFEEDLSGVDLKGRVLVGCDFSGAMFGKEPDLRYTNFNNCRFGPSRDELLVNLQGADFTEAQLQNAILTEVSLKNCKFIRAKLSSADLSFSDCTYADFSNATLDGVDLESTNLFQANLNETRISFENRWILQSNVDAWRKWCKLHYNDVGDAVRLEQGTAIYLELKENFRSIGAYSEASWAYTMERRMRRSQHHPQFVASCFASNFPGKKIEQLIFYMWHTAIWLLDYLVDITTGYGESLLKPVLTIGVFVALIFPWLYSIGGGVEVLAGTAQSHISYGYSDLLFLSIGNLMQGYPGYEVSTEFGKLTQVVEQLFGVLMIGLLGFILGNKINQR